MLEWHYEGYIRWLRGHYFTIRIPVAHSVLDLGLRLQYKQRRDFFVDCLHDEFHIESTVAISGALEGCSVYLAFDKLPMPTSDWHEKISLNPKPEAMFSFVPPTSGMFVWVGDQS